MYQVRPTPGCSSAGRALNSCSDPNWNGEFRDTLCSRAGFALNACGGVEYQGQQDQQEPRPQQVRDQRRQFQQDQQYREEIHRRMILRRSVRNQQQREEERRLIEERIGIQSEDLLLFEDDDEDDDYQQLESNAYGDQQPVVYDPNDPLAPKPDYYANIRGKRQREEERTAIEEQLGFQPEQQDYQTIILDAYGNQQPVVYDSNDQVEERIGIQVEESNAYGDQQLVPYDPYYANIRGKRQREEERTTIEEQLGFQPEQQDYQTLILDAYGNQQPVVYESNAQVEERIGIQVEEYNAYGDQQLVPYDPYYANIRGKRQREEERTAIEEQLGFQPEQQDYQTLILDAYGDQQPVVYESNAQVERNERPQAEDDQRMEYDAYGDQQPVVFEEEDRLLAEEEERIQAEEEERLGDMEDNWLEKQRILNNYDSRIEEEKRNVEVGQSLIKEEDRTDRQGEEDDEVYIVENPESLDDRSMRERNAQQRRWEDMKDNEDGAYVEGVRDRAKEYRDRTGISQSFLTDELDEYMHVVNTSQPFEPVPQLFTQGEGISVDDLNEFARLARLNTEQQERVRDAFIARENAFIQPPVVAEGYVYDEDEQNALYDGLNQEIFPLDNEQEQERYEAALEGERRKVEAERMRIKEADRIEREEEKGGPDEVTEEEKMRIIAEIKVLQDASDELKRQEEMLNREISTPDEIRLTQLEYENQVKAEEDIRLARLAYEKQEEQERILNELVDIQEQKIIRAEEERIAAYEAAIEEERRKVEAERRLIKELDRLKREKQMMKSADGEVQVDRMTGSEIVSPQQDVAMDLIGLAKTAGEVTENIMEGIQTIDGNGGMEQVIQLANDVKASGEINENVEKLIQNEIEKKRSRFNLGMNVPQLNKWLRKPTKKKAKSNRISMETEETEEFDKQTWIAMQEQNEQIRLAQLESEEKDRAARRQEQLVDIQMEDRRKAREESKMDVDPLAHYMGEYKDYDA
jgi:hypothetical protein